MTRRLLWAPIPWQCCHVAALIVFTQNWLQRQQYTRPECARQPSSDWTLTFTWEQVPPSLQFSKLVSQLERANRQVWLGMIYLGVSPQSSHSNGEKIDKVIWTPALDWADVFLLLVLLFRNNLRLFEFLARSKCSNNRDLAWKQSSYFFCPKTRNVLSFEHYDC